MISFSLSNFEAKFVKFLGSLRISRTAARRLNSDFRIFLRFFELSDPVKIQTDPTACLTTHKLSEFSTWFAKKGVSKNRVSETVALLKKFNQFLVRERNLLIVSYEEENS